MNIRAALSQNVLGVLDKISSKLNGTPYEGKLYLVGGIVRDAVLGLPDSQDIDIVCDCSLDVVDQLKPILAGKPVVYPRFQTAMLRVRPTADDNPVKVELVRPRKESYSDDSRKPSVECCVLSEDILRRDFTINTLMANISTLEVIDHTGCGLRDLKSCVLRTPTDPNKTFYDDPLRMLRAIRFAIKYNLKIDTYTLIGIRNNAYRLPVVSIERIRDELIKIFSLDPGKGLSYLKMYRLLELTPLVPLLKGAGMVQNKYHIYDVWDHTRVAATEALRLGRTHLKGNVSDELIWAAILHDIGKPECRTQDKEDPSHYHFYDHDDIGEPIARKILTEFKFSNEFICKVSKMIGMHMRSPEPGWRPRAYRRLAVAAGDDLHELLLLMKADCMAGNPEYDTIDLEDVWKKIEFSMKSIDTSKSLSPLDGNEIQELLAIKPGPVIRMIKSQLSDMVVDGTLDQADKETATRCARELFALWEWLETDPEVTVA